MTVTGSSNDAKSRVLQAVNIVELIGQTVQLKKAGGTYKGLCPFHSEKTPSFTVNPVKQFYHCFGCKEHGNAIDFVMKRDRLSFIEALKQLADQFHIELPKFGGTKEDISQRQMLLEAQSAACSLFENLLAHPEIGKPARDYLAGRGFNAETIKKFRIGFAADSWDALLRSKAMKKFSPPQLAMAGLAKPRESGDGYYDTFRNRIMFPIRDEQGRIIAFGGRAMPESKDPAKYLNSPETPLFTKGRCAFGLDMAKEKIVETRTVAVVEGYTDVMMAHQYGASNVVSVLGTAMTEQHVSLLRRFSERIVLLFDADTAGELAVNRAVELFLTQPIEIAIASMPDGVDPDEYLLENGVEGFEKLLADAQDALSFKWKQLLKDFGSKDDLTGQQKAIEQYLGLLAAARGSGPVDALRWGSTLARVSRLTGIPVEQLNRRFRTNRKPMAQAAKENEPIKSVPSGPLTAQDRSERWLLGSLLSDPSKWKDVQKDVQPRDFADPQRRKLAEFFWTHLRDEGEPAFSELLSLLDQPQLKELAVALVEEVEAMNNLDQMLSDAMQHLHYLRVKQTDKSAMAELNDEVELLRKMQEKARQPDIRRTV